MLIVLTPNPFALNCLANDRSISLVRVLRAVYRGIVPIHHKGMNDSEKTLSGLISHVVSLDEKVARIRKLDAE